MVHLLCYCLHARFNDSFLSPYFNLSHTHTKEFHSLPICYFDSVLRDEFREQPHNVEAVIASTTTLSCRPPSGQPEPKIRWIKDGERLRTTSDRVTVTDTGNLQIRDLRREDAGSYLCVAYNVAGERESAAAQITVRGSIFLVFRDIQRRRPPDCFKYVTAANFVTSVN
jgi:Immunoglobulin I-set domain